MRRSAWVTVGALALLLGCNGRGPEHGLGKVTASTGPPWMGTPVDTTVCAISKDPAAFAGKIVRLRGTVFVAFERSVVFSQDPKCIGNMWFEFARDRSRQENDWDPRERASQTQQPVFLLKDDGLKQFEKALSAQVYPRHAHGCISCALYSITATMVGRVDYSGEQPDFGQMNEWRLQFVMASVADMSLVENRYDWTQSAGLRFDRSGGHR